VQRRLHVVAELVPFFRDDRERRDVRAQRMREIADLGRRRVATGVHAEVHAHLECGHFVRVDAECECGIHGFHSPISSAGCGI